MCYSLVGFKYAFSWNIIFKLYQFIYIAFFSIRSQICTLAFNFNFIRCCNFYQQVKLEICLLFVFNFFLCILFKNILEECTILLLVFTMPFHMLNLFAILKNYICIQHYLRSQNSVQSSHILQFIFWIVQTTSHGKMIRIKVINFIVDNFFY